MIETLLAAKSSVSLVLFGTANNTSITGSIPAICNLISGKSRVKAAANGHMGNFITNLCTDQTIKSIEIPKPVTIIEGVNIFHDTTIELIDTIKSKLVEHN